MSVFDGSIGNKHFYRVFLLFIRFQTRARARKEGFERRTEISGKCAIITLHNDRFG